MTVRAKAKVVVEIDCNSTWSDSTSMEQIKRQAIIDATESLNKLIQSSSRIRISGSPSFLKVSVDIMEGV